MQVTLFAHPHRFSKWHSSGNLDYNIDRVRWDSIPGYAMLHRTGMWWENYVKNTTMNLLGSEATIAEDKANGRADGDCEHVSKLLSTSSHQKQRTNTISVSTPFPHQQVITAVQESHSIRPSQKDSAEADTIQKASRMYFFCLPGITVTVMAL